ncbi:MAG: hypothetical protein LUD76_12650 [Alistipes sp.]|nr:hypothetical protein [Alistipes sp.]
MSQNKKTPADAGRRKFMKQMLAGGVTMAVGGVWLNELLANPDSNTVPAPDRSALPATTAEGVTLTWLDMHPPLVPVGVSWGVPWSRGTLSKGDGVVIKDKNGNAIPSQSWPLAYWPDGSVKWTGVSIAAGPDVSETLYAAKGDPAAPASAVSVKEGAGNITVTTGPMICVISNRGAGIIESLTVDGRVVGTDGRLVLLREDRSAYESDRTVREEEFTGDIESVTVEQDGPVRAVVLLKGRHARQGRRWLPFTLRLYFTAGLTSIKAVHTIEFDGEAATDFISGLGLALSVPLREEMQNRVVRLGGEQGGLWSEAVLLSPSFRDGRVKGAMEMRLRQMEGLRVANLAELDERTRGQLSELPVWDAYKLSQLSADSYSVRKRTGSHSSWLKAHEGGRSTGFGYLGDVSGGIAVGIKKFWQKHPAAIEIEGATTDKGVIKAWFWSPDAPAMDLRHYDIKAHGLEIMYEDVQPGFSTPEGIANTNELTIWALPGTPGAVESAAMAATACQCPLPVCTPAYYQQTRVLGVWSLPDRSTADNRKVEEQLDRYWNFISGEVEARRWYGFWDYGDVIRTYDTERHEWMYDIGGHAWTNTELMPDTWFWLTFLRTGRPEAFRLAEAMTRHTAEVDVHHSGRFAGLGSRHNVSHWGCGAKEARISQAFLKRHYYYLTTDERTGDLMREVLTVDETVGRIQPLRFVNPRPDQEYVLRTGPDWVALAGNWLTEWERTGDTRYRDWVRTGLECLVAMPEAFLNRASMGFDTRTKKLYDIGDPVTKASEFMVLFGGDEVMQEINLLMDYPEFEQLWNELMTRWANGEQLHGGYSLPRTTAYAAYVNKDRALARTARQRMMESFKEGAFLHFPEQLPRVEGPAVPRPVTEHGAAAIDLSQQALNLMVAPQYLKMLEE